MMFGSEGNRSLLPMYRDIFNNESLCETIPGLSIRQGEPTRVISRSGSSLAGVNIGCWKFGLWKSNHGWLCSTQRSYRTWPRGSFQAYHEPPTNVEVRTGNGRG